MRCWTCPLSFRQGKEKNPYLWAAVVNYVVLLETTFQSAGPCSAFLIFLDKYPSSACPKEVAKSTFLSSPLVPGSCRFPPESSLLTEARISITWWENIWKCDQVPLGSIIKSPFTGINIISVGASRSSPHTEFLNHIFPNSFNLSCLNKSALLYNSSLEKMSRSCCSQDTQRGWFWAQFGFLFASVLFTVIVQSYCSWVLGSSAFSLFSQYYNLNLALIHGKEENQKPI